MEKININLQNCFGIEHLTAAFDFTKDNVVAIYARNGLMKTSFSKTFKKIQEEKVSEIRDEIFNEDGIANVIVDGESVSATDVFVINSYENSYESSNITSLLVNEEVKNKINSVLKLKDNFLKTLEKKSGLKIAKTLGGKKIFELEPVIVKDLGYSEDSFLLNLTEILTLENSYNCSDIIYSSIFDESVLKKIKSSNFQSKIHEFTMKSNEIYENYNFLEKGNLTLPKLKDVLKVLEKDKYFVKNNSLILDGELEILKADELKDKIDEIETEIKAVPVLKEIEKLLSDVKGSVLKDVIETNPEIVEFLNIEKLDQLKKELWSSYIKAESTKFMELVEEYRILENIIESTNFEDSPWKKAMDIFEDRFTVPYKMEISNLKGAIIGESIPRVLFSFKKDDKNIMMDRSKLDNIDVLSQGEKRALYLLNIIFDIENRKTLDQETLFIIDDIADSFDYKNKYAIVEYLYEIAHNPKFKMIVLSHNFDFYRTICSRINIYTDNRLVASSTGNEIVLKKETYQNQPFIFWKSQLVLKNAIALIPFMRNIIDYGDDKKLGKVSGINKDSLLLTELLHEKYQTNIITFGDIKILFKEYLGNDKYKEDIIESNSVISDLYILADGINENDVDLEYKIILSMAIRHVAEKYMISKLKSFSGQLIWEKRHRQMTGNVAEFMSYLASVGNQTRELFEAFKQIGTLEKIELLGEVNIMTPENIHLNSFMYEPILDMDIVELVGLYEKVKCL